MFFEISAFKKISGFISSPPTSVDQPKETAKIYTPGGSLTYINIKAYAPIGGIPIHNL